MRVLLDSNVLYWALTGTRRLPSKVLTIVDDQGNDLHVSSASLGELSIKVAKGKLTVPGNSIRSFYEQVDRIGITILTVTKGHILRTESLPHHHRDPFDRMIVAQAMEESLTILTADSDIPKYAAPVIWK